MSAGAPGGQHRPISHHHSSCDQTDYWLLLSSIDYWQGQLRGLERQEQHGERRLQLPAPGTPSCSETDDVCVTIILSSWSREAEGRATATGKGRSRHPSSPNGFSRAAREKLNTRDVSHDPKFKAVSGGWTVTQGADDPQFMRI